MRPTARSIALGLLATAVGLGGSVVVAEVGLRLAGYVPEGSVFGYRADLAGDLSPRMRYTAGRRTPTWRGPTFSPYRLDTNAQGLRRDGPLTVSRPPGVRRILMLGDSFTFGPFLDNHETASALLEEILNRQGADSVEVINAGMLGWTVVDEREYVAGKGLRLEPELVVLQVYVNDVRELAPEFRSTLSRRGYVHVALQPTYGLVLFLRRWSAIYFVLRDLKDRLQIEREVSLLHEAAAPDLRPLWTEYLSEMDSTAALLRRRGIPLVVLLVPEPPQADPWAADWWASPTATDWLSAPADSLAASRVLSSNGLLPLLHAELDARGIPCVDLLRTFALLPPEAALPKALYLLPQDHHLSRYGNVVLAQAVARAIHEQGLLPEATSVYRSGAK